MQQLTKGQYPIKYIYADELEVVHHEAQRSLRNRTVDDIAENIDPDKFGIVTVCPVEDGKYHIIDGQHRVAALRKAWGDRQRVPCMVIEADDIEQAAKIWLGINKSRTKPNTFETFLVQVTAQQEPEYTVQQVIDDVGYTVDYGKLMAVGTCVSIYNRTGAAGLRWVLSMCRKHIWPADAHDSVKAPVLDGLCMFYENHAQNPLLDEARLINNVSERYTPHSLIGAARAAREVLGGSVRQNVYRVLLRAYNTGLRGDSTKRLSEDG